MMCSPISSSSLTSSFWHPPSLRGAFFRSTMAKVAVPLGNKRHAKSHCTRARAAVCFVKLRDVPDHFGWNLPHVWTRVQREMEITQWHHTDIVKDAQWAQTKHKIEKRTSIAHTLWQFSHRRHNYLVWNKSIYMKSWTLKGVNTSGKTV